MDTLVSLRAPELSTCWMCVWMLLLLLVSSFCRCPALCSFAVSGSFSSLTPLCPSLSTPFSVLTLRRHFSL